MADQKRWFKVWTSLIVSMDYLPADAIGHWTRLGCRIAMVGKNGTATFQGWEHLAQFLGVTVTAARNVCDMLPHMSVEESENRHGKSPVTVCVTMDNWTKYQEDLTQAERAKRYRASRLKKRGEEIRGDKINNPPNPPTRGAHDQVSNSNKGTPPQTAPDDVPARLPRHHGQHERCSRCDLARARERERLEQNAPMYRPYAPPTPPPPDPFERPEEHQRQLDALRRVKALIGAPAADRRAGLASVAEILAGSAPQHGQNGQPA